MGKSAASKVEVIKRNLRELAAAQGAGRERPSETQPLTEGSIARFVHDPELTSGSKAIEDDSSIPSGPEEWDNIYYVALKSGNY